MALNSKEYWKRREEEQLKHNITEEAAYSAELDRIYADMLDSVQTQIDSFYGKYATKEGITLAEAKKRVKNLDIEAYERKAAKYVAEKNFSKQANEEMRLYNATMKINRLEMLKANIALETIAGHDELEKYMEDILQGRTMDELKRQAGILGKSITNNAKAAKAIVNGSFHSGTFSDRIWQYQDLMRSDLEGILARGLIQGKNPRALASELKKYWYGNDPLTGGGARYCMERLMRTELARVQTEAQKQSFERNGFTMYMFIENGDCCPICKQTAKKDSGHGDGVYLVKDMMPGTNAPPMHPNCRCSVAAHEDDAEYEAWLDYISKGGTTEEWNALKAQNINKALTNKGAKGGIMQSPTTSGALTSKNDPDFEKRDAFAASFYQEILGRKREYEISSVAQHSNMSVADVDKIFAHIFELEHLFEDGSIRKFDSDYDMAQSWIRLRNGKNVQEHDLILLQHELMEANIMGTGTTVPYEPVHNEVEKTYNYALALREYLEKNDLL